MRETAVRACHPEGGGRDTALILDRCKDYDFHIHVNDAKRGRVVIRIGTRRKLLNDYKRWRLRGIDEAVATIAILTHETIHAVLDRLKLDRASGRLDLYEQGQNIDGQWAL